MFRILTKPILVFTGIAGFADIDDVDDDVRERRQVSGASAQRRDAADTDEMTRPRFDSTPFCSVHSKFIHFEFETRHFELHNCFNRVVVVNVVIVVNVITVVVVDNVATSF